MIGRQVYPRCLFGDGGKRLPLFQFHGLPQELNTRCRVQLVVEEARQVEQYRHHKHLCHRYPSSPQADEIAGLKGLADGQVPPYGRDDGQPGATEDEDVEDCLFEQAEVDGQEGIDRAVSRWGSIFNFCFFNLKNCFLFIFMF